MFGSLTLVLVCSSLLPAQVSDPGEQVAQQPTSTPALVTDYMTSVADRFYDPRADGLRSLSFTLPLEDSIMGHTANVRIQWASGAEPKVDVELLDFELPPMLAQAGMSLEQIRMSIGPQSEMAGRDFLYKILGNMLGGLANDRVGSMVGVEEGQIVVRFGASSSMEDPVKEHLLHIDDDAVLRKHVIVLNSPMGEQRVEHEFGWQPARDGEQLLAKSMTMTVGTPMGPMEFQTINYGYRQVGQLLLLTDLTTEVKIPTPQKVVQSITDVVVNGEVVELDDAMAPAGEPGASTEGTSEG